jgi:retinol dehydrogenase 12
MTDMTGKRVLITGATAGIGKETARQLRAMGADVIIVGRSREKTVGVREELEASPGSGKLDHFIADLSSMDDVRRLADEFTAKYDALNVLVNNAGAVNMSRQTTRDGLELTFAMNHLAYFLLAQLLVPALERGAPARIVNVASEAHRSGPLDFDDLQSEKSYSAFRVYGRSKLANILFTREFARRLDPEKITVNSLHPGVVASNFMAKPGIWGVLGKIASVFMISNQSGASTSVYLASSDDVRDTTGKYFAKSREKTPTRAAQDDIAAKRLWDVSARLVGMTGDTSDRGASASAAPDRSAQA